MLKIKENVDLQELEKFGFKNIQIWGSSAYVYDFVPYSNLDSSYLVATVKKEISVAWVNFRQHSNKCLNLLYDLIQAGLVEKVKE